MSAYDDIEAARAEALRVLLSVADRYALGTADRAAIEASVQAAYDDSESWFDWGESEAGAFWSALAADTSWRAGFPAGGLSDLDAWLSSAGVAVASSEAASVAASPVTIVMGTVEESAADVNEVAAAAGEAGGQIVTAAKTPWFWIGAGALALLVLVKR